MEPIIQTDSMIHAGLISSSYTPPISHLYLINHYPDTRVEMHENYQKQSFRNRMYLISSSGLQLLTVPIVHKQNQLFSDVKISYSEPWQRNHIRTIRTCYSNAPYYIYYSDLIENAISSNFTFLHELNNQLLHTICKSLNIQGPTNTETWEKAQSHQADFRDKIKIEKETRLTTPAYPALFPFDPNTIGKISSLDLLFNLGPDGESFLNASKLVARAENTFK
jgi:hypothetical protein